jgi:hypothetical protein
VTTQEERAVEQRTRIREARYALRAIADDANPPPEPIESELRGMARRLQQIEEAVSESVSVRKTPARRGGANEG